MHDFPTIREDDKWSDTSARQWTNLVKVVEAFANLEVGAGLIRKSTPNGVRIELTPGTLDRLDTYRRVCPVEMDPDGRFMRVRAVKYHQSPPTPNELAWASQPFIAYPAVGCQLVEFASAVYDDALDPTADAVILDCRKIGDFWYVSAPSVTELQVVVRGYLPDDPDGFKHHILVQEIEPEIIDGQWTERVVPVGSVIDVPLWPPMLAFEYAPLVWQADELTEATTIVPLTWFKGHWWLKQRFMRGISKRVGPVRHLDCSGI